MILDKNIYKKIEHYLYTHFESKEQLAIDEDDIVFGCKGQHLGEETGGSMSTNNESKVERAAIQLADLHDSEESKWSMVMQQVLNDFKDTEYEKIIDLTYNRQIRVTKILMIMHIEKSAYYERRNDIITQVALRASASGLIENNIAK